MMNKPLLPCLIVAIVTASQTELKAQTAAPTEQTISFAKEAWNAAAWTSIRLPHQQAPVTFTQRDNCLATGAFSAEETKTRTDNAVLVTDTGLSEGVFEATFTIGSKKGTAPGFAISPVCEDGVLVSAVAVFVASYTIAIWKADVDRDKGETTYRHLARLNRTFPTETPLTFRCRYSAKRQAVWITAGDSDEIHLRDIDHTFNSTIGIWGCHGPCEYYSLNVKRQ